MKKNSVFKIASIGLAATLLGCSSDNARYVDTGGTRALVSTDKINMSDWNAAATSLVNEMLASGVFDRFEQKPVRLMVSRIVNRTSQSIDTELLTTQVTIVLNNSGKAVAVTDDKASQELAEMQRFLKDSKVPLPTVTISGRIIEDRESVGSVKEVTYVFMMNVNSDGLAVWQGQKQLTKQKDKSWFGF
jgi:hypothetical protein